MTLLRTGQQIEEQELLRKDLNSNSAQVDLSYFSQAIYLFKVEGPNGTNTFKLQKN